MTNDEKWLEEFRDGLVKVDEYARVKLKQIDRQIEELESEKRRLTPPRHTPATLEDR